MKPYIFGLLLMLLAACRTGTTETPLPTGTPPPVVTVQPSDTPAPTLTPAPPTATSLPTEAVTPTAAGPATPDPNLGVGDVVYEDRLDGSSGWEWLFEDSAATFSVSGGQLNAVMKQGNVGPRFSVREDLKVGDQQLRVTARPNLCYERDEYGVMFRMVVDSQNNYHGYIFKLNCGGQARVERLENVETIPLADWTPSPGIVPGAPAENTLMVWMAKDQLHFYVNDKYLFSVTDATYAEGFYGFYLRDRTNGGESVSFVNLVAKEVKLP